MTATTQMLFVLLTWNAAGDMQVRTDILTAELCAARLERLRLEQPALTLAYCTKPGEAHTFKRSHAGS